MQLRLLSLNTWGLPFGLARDLPRRGLANDNELKPNSATESDGDDDITVWAQLWLTALPETMLDLVRSMKLPAY